MVENSHPQCAQLLVNNAHDLPIAGARLQRLDDSSEPHVALLVIDQDHAVYSGRSVNWINHEFTLK